MSSDADRVILVHGWLGLPSEMRPLGRAFEDVGFNVGYVRHYSSFGRFESAVEATLKAILAEPHRPVHLVGFSMGGLVVRAAANACPAHISPMLSSMLLIGTPHAGSSLADLLCTVYPTPSVKRLRSIAPPLPEPPAGLRVGCIAGTHGGYLGSLLEGANDSRVTVRSAFNVRHEFEALVHCKHEVLRHHPDVLRHALGFIQGNAREELERRRLTNLVG